MGSGNESVALDLVCGALNRTLNRSTEPERRVGTSNRNVDLTQRPSMPKQGPRTLHVSMSHICRKTLLSPGSGRCGGRWPAGVQGGENRNTERGKV